MHTEAVSKACVTNAGWHTSGVQQQQYHTLGMTNARARERTAAHLDPLLISEGWPHMMRLSDDGLVRLQNHACLVHIDMKGSQDKDEPGEGSVGGDGLQPVIIDVEQHHLRLCGLEDQVTKLLNLQSCLKL